MIYEILEITFRAFLLLVDMYTSHKENRIADRMPAADKQTDRLLWQVMITEDLRKWLSFYETREDYEKCIEIMDAIKSRH